jgi:hypothetical protein
MRVEERNLFCHHKQEIGMKDIWLDYEEELGDSLPGWSLAVFFG